MNNRNIQLFHDTILRLLHRGAQKNLEKVIEKTHAGDLTQVIRTFDVDSDKRMIFNLASRDKKAEILRDLEDPECVVLLENMDNHQIVDILHKMPSDAVTSLLRYLPEDVSAELLKLMEPVGSEVIEELLKYPADTAGGIMTTEYCALPDGLTVSETIRKFQTEVELDHLFYVYVVNEVGHLVGCLSLRKLLQTKPETKISEMMITDVIKVRTDADQEEVAKMVARYNLLALPVVDESDKLVGIVTVDDIVDVIREEATEDMLRMGGAGDMEALEKSSFRSARSRLPWLLVSLLGGLVAFHVMGYFQSTFQSTIALAFFIPLLMGMNGNIAIQASSIVMSGLATGRIQLDKVGPPLWKELKIGLLFGCIYGIIVGTFAEFQYGGSFPHLGLVVGGALILSMTFAAVIGSFLPIFFEKFKMDPALSTGPFVTAVVDILGIIIYLILATSVHGTS